MDQGKKQVVPATLLLSVLLLAVCLSRSLTHSTQPCSLSTLPSIERAELGVPPRETSWQIPDYPAIEEMRESILDTFRLCEAKFNGVDGVVHGMVPAREYGMIFVRDTSTMMPALQYFYGDHYLRTPLEELLRRQYGPDTRSTDGHVPGNGAISAVIAPDGHIDKATVVSDEETNLIHAAYSYYHAVAGTDWLRSELNGETIIRRLNRALDWLYTHRFDDTHQLIKRGHTTDWGDIKFEDDANPTDLDPDTDHWTCSVYDQALTYRALLELAEMNQAVGDGKRASELRARAQRLRISTNDNLWDLEGGYYRIHLHATPLAHPFPEGEMIGIGNAMAAQVGLAGPLRDRQIFAALEQARVAAGAGKPGLSLYPPYPDGFFAHPQMTSGEYQNGGIWDWWGGLQITSEFVRGCSSLGWAHLRMVAEDWSRHPKQVYEWESPVSGEGWGAENYASAAATVADAIVRGLFGVAIEQEKLAVQPRLGKHRARVSVIQPATGLYVSYQYTNASDFIVLDYGSNHPRSLEIGILVPGGKEIEEVSIDGVPLTHRMETVLHDTYCTFDAPSGVHRAVLRFKSWTGLGAHHTASRSTLHTPPS